MKKYKYYNIKSKEVWAKARTSLAFFLNRYDLVLDDGTILKSNDVFSISETINGPIVTLSDFTRIPYHKIAGGV